MSRLDAIQENDIGVEKSERKPLENFALEVVRYSQDSKSRDAIEGIRLDTGKEVTVVLRPYTGPLKAPRAEIKDFVAEKGEISTLLKSLPSDEMRKQMLQGIKAKTEPGGTIIVQGSYTEENGTVNARWLKSASKYPGHSQVLPKIMLRVNPIKYKKREGQTYASASATALFSDSAQRVHSAEDLSSALKMAFKGADSIKGQPIVLVRLAHEDETKAFEFPLPGHIDPTTNQYTLDTPEQAAACVLKMEVGKKIAELAKHQDLLVEVIPGTRITLGPHTKASFENKNSERSLEQINRSYRFSTESDKETGFTESYLVLHPTKGGWHVFSAAGPLSNKPFLFHARDTYTPHFIAGHPIVTFEDQEQPHPNEPSIEVADVSEEDMGFEIDDVVNEQLSAETAPPQVSQPAPRMRM